MKYLIASIILCFTLAAKAQSLTVYDILILNTIEEISWSQYYLVGNKGFTFLYYSGKDKGGWDNYHFQKGGENVVVGIGSGTSKTGEFIELTQIHYRISGYEKYKAFVDLMKKFDYEEINSFKGEDGSTTTLWSGSLNLHDKLHIISIEKTGEIYTISCI